LPSLNQDIIETLSELKQMHQLNYELIEQLNMTVQWILDSNIRPPNERLLSSLLTKSLSLIAEVNADSPKTLVYQKHHPTKFHNQNLPDEDFKEPLNVC
jgi:hypothetical protein